MNSIINAMVKYDHGQHELSDWLLELDQRFQLGEVETDKSKIIWCQLPIGATGNSILAGLEDDTTWETAKETLLSRLGAGSVRDEAWVVLKNLTRGTKEIIELAGEAEKLAKRLHPQDAEAAERHAVDAFLGALDRPLATEVRKLGHAQMERVVADARRIEKILQEQPTPAADSALEAMNRQIQILKKDLIKANERLVAQSATPPQTASLALPATPVVAAAQPPPANFAPSPGPQAMASPPQHTMEAAIQGASLPLPRAIAQSPSLSAQQGRLPVAEESMASPPAASQPAPPSGLSPASTNLAHPHTASCARLLQTADIPPETARLVRCHNPWPSEDVLFCPDGALPAFVTSIPALSSGPELWYAVHNHRPEPLQLHAGQSIGVLEVVQLAEASASAPPSSMHPPSPPCQPPIPENLSPLQQQQLNKLFKEYIGCLQPGR